MADRVSLAELNLLSLREIGQLTFNRRFVPTPEYLAEREKELVPYQTLWESLQRGFYPELWDAPSGTWQDFYRSYVATYLEHEVLGLIGADSLQFTKFLSAAALRTAEILNYAELAGSVGISVVKAKKWLSVLEGTGIIWRLPPYGKGKIIPKLYFRDTGLACYLRDFRSAEDLRHSCAAGKLFETLVVGEIIKSFSNEGYDHRFGVFYYPGQGMAGLTGSDITLVISEDGVAYPIAIQSAETPCLKLAAAFEGFEELGYLKRGLGVILCSTDHKHYLGDDVLVLPLSYL